jgi:hypothetical protein
MVVSCSVTSAILPCDLAVYAGNNAVEMQTTATWDSRTSTFIIHR